jgi:hypothetical protein
MKPQVVSKRPTQCQAGAQHLVNLRAVAGCGKDIEE